MNAHPAAGPGKTATRFHARILLFCICFAVLASAVLGPVLPAMEKHFAAVPNIQTLVPVIVTVPMLALVDFGQLAGAAPGISFRPPLLARICCAAFVLGAVFMMVPVHLAYRLVECA